MQVAKMHGVVCPGWIGKMAFPSMTAIVCADVLDLLIAEFGPVDEPGFDDSEVDPSFLERWW